MIFSGLPSAEAPVRPKSMVSRATLLLSGLMYLGFGLLLFIYPAALEQAQMMVRHPTALMETRAFYGGLEIGLGIFLLFSLVRSELQKPALLLLVLILSGTLSGRLVGAWLDGLVGSYFYIALAVEVPIWLLAVVSFRQSESSSVG